MVTVAESLRGRKLTKSELETITMIEIRESKMKAINELEAEILEKMEMLQSKEKDLEAHDEKLIELIEIVEDCKVPTDRKQYEGFLANFVRQRGVIFRIGGKYNRQQMARQVAEYLKFIDKEVSTKELSLVLFRLGYRLKNWSELMSDLMELDKNIVRTRRGYYTHFNNFFKNNITKDIDIAQPEYEKPEFNDTVKFKEPDWSCK